MSWLDEIWAVSSDAPVSFFLGGIVGYWLSTRYRIVKRKRKEAADDAT